MTSARPPPVKRMPRPPWAPAIRAAKLITSPPRWYISRYAWSWVDREEHERGEEGQVDLRLQPSGPPRHHGEHTDDDRRRQQHYLCGAEPQQQRSVQPDFHHRDRGNGQPDTRH